MYAHHPPYYGRERSLSSPSAPPVDNRSSGYQVTPQAPPQDRRGSFQSAPAPPYEQFNAPLYPDIGQNNPPPTAPNRDSFIQNYDRLPPDYGSPPPNYGTSQQNSQHLTPPAPPQQNSQHFTSPAPFLREPTLYGGYGPVQPGSFSSSTSSMALMPDGMTPTPSSVVELRFRCKGLKKSDFLSQSDPFIVLYMQEAQKRGWKEIGRTETINNTPDPTFAKSFQVDFFFEEVQRLRVEVFDRDSSSERLSDHDFLGCVEITMGQLMSSKGQSAVLKLLQNDKGRGHVHNLSGHVVIDAEEVSTCADMINVRFTATKLDNKDGWFGASDPFLNIYRLRDENADPHATTSWVLVWRSEVVMNDCDPKWRRATLSVQTLCNGNLSRLLKIECMDWEKNGKHQFIGSCTVRAAEFVTGEFRSMDLINRERQAKKGKRYKNSGVLVLEQIELFKRHTFAEYLRGGCEAAISATGAILEPYDSDKRFPVYGFGGLVNGAVNHCFSLTFDPSQPEVEGVSGILSAYSNSFQFVQLHGPTMFAPLVHQAAAIARTFSAPVEQGGGGDLKYFVLLIITDGAIMDMQQTIDELVQASTLPLSIVIVAVGNADFTAMNALDSDDKLLVDSRRQRAARDIVQFVPFNQFRRNPARLAKETLAEIPTQLLEYYNMKGIQPRGPLRRQGTSYLVSSSISSGMADALDVEV
ncbi:Copine [Phytophthora megakarya]|uniref:Copine n=1 Tax=Phytophthora megakarya TaxID=4795 RepID=A0A225W8V8_9STRA|nr:Copine [Phytophthora megakarya]